jgi:hypothetical protein
MADIWYASDRGGATVTTEETLKPEHTFTYRSARSGSLLAGIGIALLAETLVLHLWLVSRHPLIALTMTAISVATLAWLAADYVAMGRGTIRMDGEVLVLDVGRRFALRVPRASLASVVQPDWRDIPEAGTPAASDYLNLMKPAPPNVLLTLAEPSRVRIAGGIRRTVRRIGLHVDEPQRLVEALGN